MAEKPHLPKPRWFAAATALAGAVLALTGDETWTFDTPGAGQRALDFNEAKIDGGAADRVITLPDCSELGDQGVTLILLLHNSGATNKLTFNDAGGTARLVLDPGESGILLCAATVRGGQLPAATTSANEFADDQFNVYDPADQTKKARLDASAVSAGQTRAILLADRDANLAFLPQSIRKTVGVADLTAAALSQAIDFDAAIPANSVVLAVIARLGTEFSGGGATLATADIGDTTTPDGYFNNQNVFTGAGAGTKQVATTPGTFLGAGVAADTTDIARTFRITITSDVNVDQLTAGELTVIVLYVPGDALP